MTRGEPAPLTTVHDSVAAALVTGTVLAADPAGWFAFAPAKWLITTTLAATAVALTAWERTWRGPDRRTTLTPATLLGMRG